MIFTELPEPVEAFDFRSFESLPTGRWQTGISRMLFAKYRVGISLKGSHTYTPSATGAAIRAWLTYLLAFSWASACGFQRRSQQRTCLVFSPSNKIRISRLTFLAVSLKPAR